MGVFAELDRKMVAKRLRDGRVAKAAAGRKAVGEYPFGYAATGKGRERDVGPAQILCICWFGVRVPQRPPRVEALGG